MIVTFLVAIHYHHSFLSPIPATSDLFCAANKGDPTKIKSFLSSTGATNFDINDCYGFKPLIIASFYGHTSVVKELLKAGSDVNVTNEAGHTSLYYASREGHRDVVEMLLDHGMPIAQLGFVFDLKKPHDVSQMAV